MAAAENGGTNGGLPELRSGSTSSAGGTSVQQRASALPVMLALDDGLVAAVVRVLRQRRPDGGLEPELALQSLQLITSIVVAKASARQLLRCPNVTTELSTTHESIVLP